MSHTRCHRYPYQTRGDRAEGKPASNAFLIYISLHPWRVGSTDKTKTFEVIFMKGIHTSFTKNRGDKKHRL